MNEVLLAMAAILSLGVVFFLKLPIPAPPVLSGVAWGSWGSIWGIAYSWILTRFFS